MAPVCADTSFLFSLYGSDANTRRALQHLQRTRRPVTITSLNEFELLNAVRFAAFRKVIAEKDALAFAAAFEADIRAGHLVMASCNLAAVVREARRLSAVHTLKGGHRSFDILHVASAVVLEADGFLTFDANQRRLAKAGGMIVEPS